MVQSITNLINGYYSKSVIGFESIITREEKKLSKAFIYLSIEIYKFIESRIKEDETLTEYRKETQEAFKNNGLKGSNYTFANIIKIGKIAESNINWLLSFKSLTSLAIGLASFETMPSCKGVKNLDIVPVVKDNKTTVQSVIETIKPEDHSNESLREIVNNYKGIKPKAEIVKDSEIVKESEIKSAMNQDSLPRFTESEKTALQLAKVISSYREDKSFLLAFAVQLQNLKVIEDVKEAIDNTIKNNKRIDLSI